MVDEQAIKLLLKKEFGEGIKKKWSFEFSATANKEFKGALILLKPRED